MKYLLIVLVLASCATPPDPKEKKATYQRNFRQINYKAKAYTPSFWERKFDTDELFADDKKTQKQISEANKDFSRGNMHLWGGLVAALVYLNSTSLDNFNPTIYWTIFIGLGAAPSIYYDEIGSDKVEKAIDEHNKRNGLSYSPMIFRDQRYGVPGLLVHKQF